MFCSCIMIVTVKLLATKITMTKILLPRGFRDAELLERELLSRPEKRWQRIGNARALMLFHQMAERVPAYKDFLKKSGVSPKTIKNIADFKKLPTIDKNNYLRAYPREQLVWDGDFKNKSWTISTTSGSTGKPFYFPREATQDYQYASMAELYLRTNFQIQNRSTLYIVAFPMGAWIGGLFTYEALKIIAETGRYNLSVITPGIHKKEIIEAVKQLGSNFDQVLIGSYAPFLKDILDDGAAEGINWKSYNLGFIFSAEGFSEVFRDYIVKKTGIDPIRSTLNHYGTVDLGTMAHETPLSIMLRRDALSREDMYETMFSRLDKLPTLAQYNPSVFYFEEEKGDLICSSYSGIPLVRYDLKDSGGITSFNRLRANLAKLGYDLDGRIDETGIKDTVWNLPFVYVYERNDFSVSFFAFQIYAEMVRRPLQDVRLDNHLTGKFSMRVYYDDEGQQKLEINAELKDKRKDDPQLRERVRALVVDSLLKESSEYRETYKMYGDRIFPEIVLWPYEHERHFKSGVKQKWVMN